MKELIKVEEREGVQTCNARELHEFMEVKTRFNDWITGRVKKYGFVEGVDFVLLTENLVSGNNAISKTYYLSIDMAKELSMVENNEKGKEARRYFIAMERKALANTPQTYLEALKALVISEEKKEALQIENKEMIPKAQFYDDVTGSKDAIEMRNVAKVINSDLGRNQLFSYLRRKKVLMKDNTPYQRFVDNDWFRVVESKYADKNTGDIKINIKTLVYQKGIDGIIKALRKDGFM